MYYDDEDYYECNNSDYLDITEIWQCNNIIDGYFLEHNSWSPLYRHFKKKRNAIDDSDFNKLKELAEEIIAAENALK
jgi:hypothetical protein